MVSIETMDSLRPRVLTLLPATARAVAKVLDVERRVVSAILFGEREKKITEIKGKGGKIWSIVGAPQQALPLKPPKSLRAIDYNASKRQGIYPELKELQMGAPAPKSLMVEVAELSVRVKQLEKFVGIVR